MLTKYYSFSNYRQRKTGRYLLNFGRLEENMNFIVTRIQPDNFGCQQAFLKID
jgi:hypothetical protein